MEKYLEIKEGRHGRVHLKKEGETEFIVSMGDYKQGEDASFSVEVYSSSKVNASVSCRGCLKAYVESEGEDRYKVTIKYDTTFLGRIIKRVWIKNNSEEQITLSLRGFVEK